MFANIKHIFFDLDDTLWDFEKNSGDVLEQLFGEYNLSAKLKTDFTVFHSTYREVNNEFWRQYYQRKIDKQYLRNNRFNETFKKFGYNNYEENLLVTEQYLQRSPYGKQLKDNCIDVLNYLKPNYQLHIITNGFKEVQNIKLDNSGLRNYFNQIIISEEHALTKPDVKIFRLAEQFANCKARECVMIGDNLESDIDGALNAGWKAIYLGESRHEKNALSITGLSELKGHFIG